MPQGCAAPNLAEMDRHIQLSMLKRNWVADEIREAYDQGLFYSAVDMTANNAPATRFIHPINGKSVVINNATGKIIHGGGKDFQY